MKRFLLVTILPAALIFAGCSSTPTETSSGAITASSFSFVTRGTAPDFADNREQIHSTIQRSITRNLAARGLSRKPSGGDVTVAYLVVAGNNTSTESINTYFGYGRDSGALADKAHDAYIGSSNPNYFEAGTLLIDIIDGRTHKLLHRSHVVRPLLRDASAAVRAERIQEAVDATLQNVRINTAATDSADWFPTDQAKYYGKAEGSDDKTPAGEIHL